MLASSALLIRSFWAATQRTPAKVMKTVSTFSAEFLAHIAYCPFTVTKMKVFDHKGISWTFTLKKIRLLSDHLQHIVMGCILDPLICLVEN